jgi:hypothetical protein
MKREVAALSQPKTARHRNRSARRIVVCLAPRSFPPRCGRGCQFRFLNPAALLSSRTAGHSRSRSSTSGTSRCGARGRPARRGTRCSRSTGWDLHRLPGWTRLQPSDTHLNGDRHRRVHCHPRHSRPEQRAHHVPARVGVHGARLGCRRGGHARRAASPSTPFTGHEVLRLERLLRVLIGPILVVGVADRRGWMSDAPKACREAAPRAVWRRPMPFPLPGLAARPWRPHRLARRSIASLTCRPHGARSLQTS